MKDYIAVVSVDGNKVTKYADFDSQSDADAHVAVYGGFAVENPGGKNPYWIANAANKTLSYDKDSFDEDEAAFTATQYQRDRKKEFSKKIGDQLDMIYWDQVNGTTTFKDFVAKIKSDNPKPE
jgi:hypothetical protein|tara:strand:- start:76 stop:444 length:369 start_codon:yes stop_codon:yes gene_type:complete